MKDSREGVIGPDGKWWGPEKIHAWCARRMIEFDLLRREARDLINENGVLEPHEIKTSGVRYRKFRQAYRWRP